MTGDLITQRTRDAHVAETVATVSVAAVGELFVDDARQHLVAGDARKISEARFLAADTVELLKAWIQRAELTEGALFRALDRAGSVCDRLSDRGVARAFQRLARAAGADVADISGHSCRVGGAQDMVSYGLELGEVMQAGGWKTPAMVARYSEKQIARRGAAAKLAALQNRL